MRPASPALLAVLALLLAPVLLPARAMAAPGGAPNESKPWHVGHSPLLTVYPEIEPNDNCAIAQAWSCGDAINPAELNPAGDNDLYVMSATQGALITCGTDEVPGQMAVDTYIDLYASDCVTRLAYDDDGGPDLYSLIQDFSAPYTGTYYLHVRAYSSTETGWYTAFLTCATIAPPPPNDRCEGAILLDSGSSGTLSGSTRFAHNDYDPGVPGPSCTGYTAAGKEVIYRLEGTVGNPFTVSYTRFSADASVYILTDCANPSASCVAGADSTLTGQPETLNYTFVSTGTYYLVLDSYGDLTGGDWTMSWTYYMAPPPAGACCLPDQSCLMLTAEECEARHGMYRGTGVPCTPEICVPSATRSTTWGRVKTLYR